MNPRLVRVTLKATSFFPFFGGGIKTYTKTLQNTPKALSALPAFIIINMLGMFQIAIQVAPRNQLASVVVHIGSQCRQQTKKALIGTVGRERKSRLIVKVLAALIV